MAVSYKRQIDFVVKTFAPKGVAELECLATAFYITREEGEKQSVERRAACSPARSAPCGRKN